MHQVAEDKRPFLAERKFESWGSVVDKLAELEKNAGQNTILAPTDKWTDKEWAAHHQAMGIPADAQGHGTYYGAFEYDGQKADPGMAKFALENFPAAGVTKRMADKLVPAWNKHIAGVVKEANERRAADRQKGDDAFAASQGAKAQESLAVVNRAAEHFGLSGEKLAGLKDLMGAEAANKFLLTVGHAVATDGEGPGEGAASLTLTTKDQAKAEIARMTADPVIAAALRDNSHKDHKTLTEKWNRLHDVMDGVNTRK